MRFGVSRGIADEAASHRCMTTLDSWSCVAWPCLVPRLSPPKAPFLEGRSQNERVSVAHYARGLLSRRIVDGKPAFVTAPPIQGPRPTCWNSKEESIPSSIMPFTRAAILLFMVSCFVTPPPPPGYIIIPSSISEAPDAP